ncbi:MAG: hypothetical protein J6V99_04880 [Neisseriaceae bacterium]|nr:hypothetical protein [Neisseriaceae bacterium]
MQTFFKEFVILINILYWLPMFICIAAGITAVWALGSYFKIKKVYRVIFSAIIACLMTLPWYLPAKKAEEERIAKYNERQAKYEAAKAVFDEQCKKAGEKIYRTVDNVDGIMLLKVRQNKGWHKNDPMFEDAIIAAREEAEHGYIGSFLQGWYSFRNKGYSFVDVLNEDGSIKRYLDYKNYGSFMQDQDGVIKNPSDPARYAVTYENNVDPELRKHWVAGTTIRVIDRQTDELLAEKTIFAFARTMGTYSHGAWAMTRLDTCPDMEELGQEFTAQFTMTVLKP